MYYILPSIILLLGLVLIVFFTPLVWRQGTEQSLQIKTPSEQTTDEPIVLEYLQSLAVQIDFLKDDFSNFKQQVQMSKNQTEELGKKEAKIDKAFDMVLAEQQNQGNLPDMELYGAVFQARDAGKSVTEIAKELGRGKGEIELILNLRR